MWRTNPPLRCLELVRDVELGDWIIAGLGEWGTVASVVPTVFPEYARVFHPAWRRTARPPDAGSDGEELEVRWSEVAATNGRVAHPAMEWAAITGHWRYHWGHGTQPGLWDRRPDEGSMSQRQVAELIRILRPHTSTPDECFFSIWEGFGDLDDALVQFLGRGVHPPKLGTPNRGEVVFSGPLSAATSSFGEMRYRSASHWWPRDRAWCVGTDVDLRSSYIGGTPECIDALLTDDAIEAARVAAELGLSADADQINPAPEGEYPYG